MRISDCSDVCSSDLAQEVGIGAVGVEHLLRQPLQRRSDGGSDDARRLGPGEGGADVHHRVRGGDVAELRRTVDHGHLVVRSEEHTSELQSLMRISYAVFCLKKKKQHYNATIKTNRQ